MADDKTSTQCLRREATALATGSHRLGHTDWPSAEELGTPSCGRGTKRPPWPRRN